MKGGDIMADYKGTIYRVMVEGRITIYMEIEDQKYLCHNTNVVKDKIREIVGTDNQLELGSGLCPDLLDCLPGNKTQKGTMIFNTSIIRSKMN
jgi:hypothetical protein